MQNEIPYKLDTTWNLFSFSTLAALRVEIHCDKSYANKRHKKCTVRDINVLTVKYPFSITYSSARYLSGLTMQYSTHLSQIRMVLLI